MREIVWSDVLSVEFDEIDEDHHKLVDLFNTLNHAIADGDNPDYVEAILDELIACTVWHFKHEERLMMKHDYKGFADHKEEHLALIESAQKLYEKFIQQDKQLSNDDIEFLDQWLTEHILTTDMALGGYLALKA